MTPTRKVARYEASSFPGSAGSIDDEVTGGAPDGSGRRAASTAVPTHVATLTQPAVGYPPTTNSTVAMPAVGTCTISPAEPTHPWTRA
jgi:hypothetical protein